MMQLFAVVVVVVTQSCCQLQKKKNQSAYLLSLIKKNNLKFFHIYRLSYCEKNKQEKRSGNRILIILIGCNEFSKYNWLNLPIILIILENNSTHLNPLFVLLYYITNIIIIIENKREHIVNY